LLDLIQAVLRNRNYLYGSDSSSGAVSGSSSGSGSVSTVDIKKQFGKKNYLEKKSCFLMVIEAALLP
jgi:hypothetical protein